MSPHNAQRRRLGRRVRSRHEAIVTMWRSLVVLFVILGSAQGGDGSEGTSAVPSSAPVDCAAVFPGINEACCGALSSNASSHLPMVRRPLARMAYASGSSLPYDAGHYTTCVNTEGAGYFTLSWHIDGRDEPVAELGLCLPAACRKADVERLIGAKSGDGISAGAIANNTEEAVAKAEAMLRPFGTSFCARAEVDAAAAAHCREYRAVIAVMDAAADMASELAGDGDGAGVTVGPFSLGGSDSVRVSVTSSAEERVGFFDNAKSGWAAFCAVLTVVLVIVAIVGTVLDALETTGWNERDGTTSEPLLRDAGGEAVDGGGDEEVDEDEAEELVDAGEDGERDSHHRVPSKVAEGMKMFSIRRNWPKLVAAPAEPSPTDCLNGMRVLSMVWIVLGHTMMMPAPINGFDNPEDLVATFGARSQVWFMTVIGGQIAVDTFFFLGGFLVAYLGVRDLEKRGGKIPYGAMVLHRYLRITPAFAFTMVFYSQIVSRIGDGPFFVRFQHSVFRRCDNASWVTSLVYLHNFVPFDSDQVCMGWSWYLGCDMIFFILSPALLLLHHHRPKVMWTVMIAAAVASSALTVRSLPPVLTYPRVRPTR